MNAIEKNAPSEIANAISIAKQAIRDCICEASWLGWRRAGLGKRTADRARSWPRVVSRLHHRWHSCDAAVSLRPIECVVAMVGPRDEGGRARAVFCETANCERLSTRTRSVARQSSPLPSCPQRPASVRRRSRGPRDAQRGAAQLWTYMEGSSHAFPACDCFVLRALNVAYEVNGTCCLPTNGYCYCRGLCSGVVDNIIALLPYTGI